MAPLGTLPQRELRRACDVMLDALNGLWPRRKLGWRTPSEAWDERRELPDDREALRREVVERAARMMASKHGSSMAEDVAMRLAIEAALVQRGYLRLRAGSGC